MKKAIIALIVLLSASVLFAATVVQTIVLVSVVEEIKPYFNLEVNYIENGYVDYQKDEVTIHSCNIKEDTYAEISLQQSLSRYAGRVDVSISVSELSWEGYSTNNLKMRGEIANTYGRVGSFDIRKNIANLNLTYTSAIQESTVAKLFITYNGDSTLPDGDYVSHIVMTYKAK